MPAPCGGGAQAADLPSCRPGRLHWPGCRAGEGDRLGTKSQCPSLSALEHRGNAELSATDDFIAGKLEFERDNIKQSQPYFDHPLGFQPGSSSILTYCAIYYAAVLVRTGNASAVGAAPHSPRRLYDARLRPVRILERIHDNDA